MTPMRIILVNHCHPETPHICAERARSFAVALAGRGHRVVLLTESRHRDDPVESPDDLAARLDAHDWTAPLVAAATARRSRLLSLARTGGLGPANRLVLAWNYLAHATVFEDWCAAARTYRAVLADRFRPHVVWGSFGNTAVLKIARALARRANAGCVFDMKDPWSNFIPDPLHRYVARRFHGADAWTALSEGHAAEVRKWFGDDATVVHSGVPAEWLRTVVAVPPTDAFRVTLSGSLYREADLRLLADGLAQWLATRSAGAPVEVHYYGNEGRRAGAALEGLRDRARFEDHGRVPVDALLRAQSAAHVNAFVANADVLFHHKVFELAAAGRPILAVPGASAEERAILARLGCALHGGGDADTVARALRMAETESAAPRARDRLADFTWDAQAGVLETVLRDAAS